MLKNNRLVYLWCLFIGGIFLISILRGINWNYHSIAAYDSSRWAHFLAYVLVAAIPVAAWRYRRDVAFCLVPVMMSIALESLQAHIPGSVVRTQNISADLFGTAAGILLGLNIRVMRNSAKSLNNVGPDVFRSLF
jgi:hypothetical protein